MSDYHIRRCLPADAAIIARHRVEMFRDMGDIPSGELAEALFQASTSAVGTALRQGSYVGWFAVHGTDVIGGAGVHIKPQLPRISSDGAAIATSQVPLIVNVYTDPKWRQRGIARALMGALMSWAVSEGYERIVLHASDAGRPLYASLGFKPTNEMRWTPAARL